MAVYRSSGAGGASGGTGNRSVSFTPAIGDLLVVCVVVSANTNNAPTMSDNQGGTYTLIQNQVWDGTGADADRMTVFVRDALCSTTSAHSITAATGSNSAGELVVLAFSRMTKAGATAVRSSGKAEGASGAAPSAALNQSALTTNPTAFFVGSADTTTTFPTSWTERQDASQTSPTTACEAATRDTGFTGTTITAGATQAAAWGCIVLELDGLQEGGGDDTIGVTDTHEQTFTAGGQSYERENTDSIDVSDAVLHEENYDRTASDTAETADTHEQTFTSGGIERSAEDTIETSDSVELSIGFGLTAADSVETSDSLDRTGTYYNRGSFLVLEIVTTL